MNVCRKILLRKRKASPGKKDNDGTNQKSGVVCQLEPNSPRHFNFQNAKHPPLVIRRGKRSRSKLPLKISKSGSARPDGSYLKLTESFFRNNTIGDIEQKLFKGKSDTSDLEKTCTRFTPPITSTPVIEGYNKGLCLDIRSRKKTHQINKDKSPVKILNSKPLQRITGSEEVPESPKQTALDLSSIFLEPSSSSLTPNNQTQRSTFNRTFIKFSPEITSAVSFINKEMCSVNIGDTSGTDASEIPASGNIDQYLSDYRTPRGRASLCTRIRTPGDEVPTRYASNFLESTSGDQFAKYNAENDGQYDGTFTSHYQIQPDFNNILTSSPPAEYAKNYCNSVLQMSPEMLHCSDNRNPIDSFFENDLSRSGWPNESLDKVRKTSYADIFHRERFLNFEPINSLETSQQCLLEVDNSVVSGNFKEKDDLLFKKPEVFYKRKMSTRREKPCRLTTHQDSSTDFPGDTFKSFERDLILKEKSADNSLFFNNDRSFETIQGFGKAADYATDYSFLHQDPFTPIRSSFPTSNSFFNQSLAVNEPTNTIGLSESETRPIYFLNSGREYPKPYIDNDSLFHHDFNFSDPGQLRANMKRKRYFRNSPPSSPIRMDFSFEIRHQKLIRSTDQLIKSIERDLMKPLDFKYNPRNEF